ncbi:hypothetical protein ACS0TY_022463 [Phlomoides rotata]
MAALSLAILSLLLFFSSSSAAAIVPQVCKASSDPPTCQSSLSHVPPDATVLQAIQSAIGVSSQNLKSGRGKVQSILDASAENLNRTNAAKNCLEGLTYSAYRTNLATGGLSRGKIKDARAWVSAALVYQHGCWSGLKNVNDTSLVVETIAFFNSSVITSTANALAMMVNYDNFGDKTASWGPPKTERDGFWESGSTDSGSGSGGVVPSGLKADATVCKAKGCDYGTVQEAVNAAPGSGKRFVIWIKAGVYEETVRVPLEKKNVVFLGDGMGKTIITGSRNVGQPSMNTFNSATVGVVGDGFMASGVTFQNTAGPEAKQAVAFRSDSDHSVIENCEFIGNQDTLYAHGLRQYYKSCRIQGNVDFIFGNSASFFQDCLILIAPRQVNPEKGETNTITAHGRTNAAQSTGFIFQDCVINGTDAYMNLYRSNPSVHKNFLGRPWKEYSRTVFIGSTLETLIIPEGWMPWSGDFALNTLYYGLTLIGSAFMRA